MSDDKFTLLVPPYCKENGSCDNNERIRFDTAVASTVNALSKDVAGLVETVKELEKIKERALMVAAIVVGGFAVIQWAANMYIRSAIDDALKPVLVQLSTLEQKDKINSILVRPESLNERIDALKGTVYSIDDRLRQLEGKERK